MGPRFKVSSERLEKPRFYLTTPDFMLGESVIYPNQTFMGRLNLSSSVVPIVASYRKLVAVARNRRQSIETFHYRLSELRYGSKCFRNIWFNSGWLGSSKRSDSIVCICLLRISNSIPKKSRQKNA